MLEAVFLDVGGVLLLPRHELVAEALERAGHDVGDDVDPDLLDRAHYHGAGALARWPVARLGTHRDAAIYEAFNAAYTRTVGVHDRLLDDARAALGTAFGHPDMWTRPAPGAAEGLARLGGTGAKLAIVSNADGQVERILSDLEICQVGEGPGTPVDAVLDSHVVGVAKPDPRIFEIALEELGVEPERAAHVGDIVGADVEGARASGVHPLHYDPYRLCELDDHDHVASLDEVAELVTATAGSPR